MHLFLKKIYRKNPFPKIYRINQCEVLTITSDEGWVRYTHQGKVYDTTIFIKKMDELTTSISYDSYP